MLGPLLTKESAFRKRRALPGRNAEVYKATPLKTSCKRSNSREKKKKLALGLVARTVGLRNRVRRIDLPLIIDNARLGDPSYTGLKELLGLTSLPGQVKVFSVIVVGGYEVSTSYHSRRQ